MFIHEGESSSFFRVARGTYRVQFAMGIGLDGGSWLFCESASYSQFDDDVTFTEVHDDEGVAYKTFELTLHPVAGGTATQTAIPPSAFAIPEP